MDCRCGPRLEGVLRLRISRDGRREVIRALVPDPGDNRIRSTAGREFCLERRRLRSPAPFGLPTTGPTRPVSAHEELRSRRTRATAGPSTPEGAVHHEQRWRRPPRWPQPNGGGSGSPSGGKDIRERGCCQSRGGMLVEGRALGSLHREGPVVGTAALVAGTAWGAGIVLRA
jgi:hypothetical protein